MRPLTDSQRGRCIKCNRSIDREQLMCSTCWNRQPRKGRKNKHQPSPDAVASPAAPERVEHSSEVEMTTTTQQPNGRKQWHAVWATGPRILSCWNCGLTQKEHISHIYCPEWRLRQLDGDR